MKNEPFVTRHSEKEEEKIFIFLSRSFLITYYITYLPYFMNKGHKPGYIIGI